MAASKDGDGAKRDGDRDSHKPNDRDPNGKWDRWNIPLQIINALLGIVAAGLTIFFFIVVPLIR